MDRLGYIFRQFKSKLRPIHAFGGVILVVSLLWLFVFSFPDKNLHLVFCDVGQGDAVLVSRGFTQVLIDGGPNEKVLGCLARHLPFWDKKLELVVLTHPEFDHLTGLAAVVEDYQIDKVIANSLISESGLFSKFREEILGKKISVYSPKAGDKIRLGDLEFDILWPKEKLGNELVWQRPESYQVLGVSAFGGNLNETGIVSLLKYGDFAALLPADVGEEQEKEIEAGPAAVLKVGHHGSKYSSSPEFLAKVQPKVAVISVGANNRYGHPTSEVLERLRNLGIKILRTDIDGEVEIVSDGKGWRVVGSHSEITRIAR